jgi:hypothetical protein
VLLVGLVATVKGELISGTLEGNSTLTPTSMPGVFVQNLTGEGDDTSFGSFIPQSQSTIDFSHPPHITISDGMLTEMFQQGTLMGTTSGDGDDGEGCNRRRVGGRRVSGRE